LDSAQPAGGSHRLALRRQAPGLWSLPRQALITDDGAGLYAYACGSYAVVLNNNPRETTVSLADWQQVASVLTTDSAVSPVAQGNQLYLPPYAGTVCRFISG